MNVPAPKFQAHNIRLADGERTNLELPPIERQPWVTSACDLLDLMLPIRDGLRVADLGCLEGGYAVEFARRFRLMEIVGLEVRDSNFACCQYARDRVQLPNLKFVQDNAWNLAAHGQFDAIFCGGLLYHLDRPREFLKLLSEHCRVLVLNTHFATDQPHVKHTLSDIVHHEGLLGRWYREFGNDADFAARENFPWSSWDNRRSFWIHRRAIGPALRDAGFRMILEHTEIDCGDDRGVFVAIK